MYTKKSLKPESSLHSVFDVYNTQLKSIVSNSYTVGFLQNILPSRVERFSYVT